jgi:hypothetical protein
MVLGAAGCSGSSSNTTHEPGDGGYGALDAGGMDRAEVGVRTVDAMAAPDVPYPAPFPTPPQVANSMGGVLKNPKIVAIFFPNDDPATVTNYEKFYADLGASAWWQALSEYGIGAPTVMDVMLTTAAPATIDDTSNSSGSNTALETWLLSEITSGALPATSGDTEYVINYPASTTVTEAGTLCADGTGGYHADMTDNSNNLIAYAVVPRCPAAQGFTVDQNFTTSASHEVIEAATDPWPDYQPGWAQADNAHLFWDEANSGSEIGDMCENDPEAYYQFSDLPFMVQRFWSNAAAKAGHDPCVPALPGETFFAAVPELPTTDSFPYYGNTVQTDAIKIPVGQSAMVTVDLYSDKPTAGWTVQVYDWLTFFNGEPPSSALLTIDPPSASGNNGDRIPFKITVTSAGNENTNGEITDTELFVVQVQQGSGSNATQHFWFGLVGQ